MRFITASPVPVNATAAANQPRNLNGIAQIPDGETFDAIMTKLLQSQGEGGEADVGSRDSESTVKATCGKETTSEATETQPQNSILQDFVFVVPIINIPSPVADNAASQNSSTIQNSVGGKVDNMLSESAVALSQGKTKVMSADEEFLVGSLTTEPENAKISAKLVQAVSPVKQTESQPQLLKPSVAADTLGKSEVADSKQGKAPPDGRHAYTATEAMVDIKQYRASEKASAALPEGLYLDELNSIRAAMTAKENLQTQTAVTKNIVSAAAVETTQTEEPVELLSQPLQQGMANKMKGTASGQSANTESHEIQNAVKSSTAEVRPNTGDNSLEYAIDAENPLQTNAAKNKDKAVSKPFDKLHANDNSKDEAPDHTPVAEKHFAPVESKVIEEAAVNTQLPIEAEKPPHMQIANEMLTNLKQDKVTFKMKLNPEGLGEVKINMVCEDGKITLHMEADTATTQKLLVSGLSDLRVELSKSNYEVVSVNVGSAKAETEFNQNSFAHLGNGGFGGNGEQYQQRQHREYAAQTLFSAERTHPKYEFFTGSLNYRV